VATGQTAAGDRSRHRRRIHAPRNDGTLPNTLDLPLRPGEICLVHAAAGGAGQWIVAAAKIRGAQVIGTVSTDAKAEIARTVGCDHVINYATADFAVEVKRITEGHGVDVVYDSVGAATWDQSLDSLRPRGMMVSFGNASGSVPPVAPLLLNQKGSIYLTRPSLGHYTSKREELEWRASDPLTIQVGSTPPQSSRPIRSPQRRAHSDLASRRTSGTLLLQI